MPALRLARITHIPATYTHTTNTHTHTHTCTRTHTYMCIYPRTYTGVHTHRYTERETHTNTHHIHIHATCIGYIAQLFASMLPTQLVFTCVHLACGMQLSYFTACMQHIRPAHPMHAHTHARTHTRTHLHTDTHTHTHTHARTHTHTQGGSGTARNSTASAWRALARGKRSLQREQRNAAGHRHRQVSSAGACGDVWGVCSWIVQEGVCSWWIVCTYSGATQWCLP